jgi:hypothetical protein
MNERQWAAFISDSGIQGTDAVQNFVPTWNGFSTDPVGHINFADFGFIVYMWTDAALTGLSDEAFMILTGVPEQIRPAANRYARCQLLDESFLRGGVALVTDTGGMVFSLEVVESDPPDSIGFDNIFTDPSAAGFKGLPAGWLISYVK